MAEGADLKSVQYRFESDGGDVLNAREWAELWASLNEEEKEAVLAMKRKAIKWREEEFYKFHGDKKINTPTDRSK